MFWPFYHSGYTITGPERVNYQHNEVFTLNCSYLASLAGARTVSWNFYRSDTYELLGSANGISPSVSFTYANGKDGIDIEMVLNFGLHQTKFRKRRRVVIIKNKATATKTLDIATIPVLSGGSVFSNSANANVVGGNANITTSAAHGASVGDIIVLTQLGTQRTYRASTGTTGTTLVLDRPWEGITGTVSNADTRRGLDIQHRFNASGVWVPGDVVHLVGTLYTARCRFINIQGTAGNEIMMTVPNGSTATEFVRMGTAQDDVFQFNDNCNHIRLIGDKDSSGNYTLKLTNGGLSAQHFSIGNSTDHNNIRIATLRVHNADSTGIKPKLDSVSRSVGAWADCWTYDNYITNSVNEGIYKGYFGYAYDSAFNGGDYHHAVKRAKCFANRIENCGWDNLQMSSCDEDSECCYNFLKNGATSNTGSQNFGLVLNGGWVGHCYNNIVIGNTMQAIPYGDTYIYNNIIYNTAYGNALFVRRGDNPGLGSPVYEPYDPAAILYVWNNILTSLADPIYILDNNDAGGTLIPMAELWIVNNILCYSGSPVEGFIRYNEPASGQVRTTSPNITTADETTIRFQDYPDDDTRLLSTSIAFSPSNIGTDISMKMAEETLPLQMFADITDQIIPEVGDWRQSPYHEYVGHEAELAAFMGRNQIQQYRTAQTENFTDREVIPRHHGGTYTVSNKILGSDKPRYLSMVRAYLEVGNPSVPTLDDTSNL